MPHRSAVGSVKTTQMPKLKHYDNLGTARFITFSCYRRLPNMNSDQTKRLFIDELSDLRKKYDLKILGYVIMPDHIHLVLIPPAGIKMGLVIGRLKSIVAKKHFATTGKPEGSTGVFWEKRCYDHNCRTPEITLEKINYCHNNPVKKKLVESPDQYQWSSFNWYRGIRDVPLKIDEFESVVIKQ